MKKAKGILGLFLLLAIVSAYAFPAFAFDVGPNANIIVKPATEGSTYESYIILGVDRSDDGSSVSYYVNPAYEGVLREMIPSGDIVEHISNLSGKDLQLFADQLYKKIKTNGISPEYTAATSGGEASFLDIPSGYTLIGQTGAGANEPFSVVMLDTAFDAETVYVTPKTETPVVEKKVLEKNDSAGGGGCRTL